MENPLKNLLVLVPPKSHEQNSNIYTAFAPPAHLPAFELAIADLQEHEVTGCYPNQLRCSIICTSIVLFGMFNLKRNRLPAVRQHHGEPTPQGGETPAG